MEAKRDANAAGSETEAPAGSVPEGAISSGESDGARSGPMGAGTASSPWPRTVFWMFAMALATGAFLAVFQSCRKLPGEAVDRTVQVVTNVTRSLRELAAAFHRGSVAFSLTSTGTELESTKYFQFKKVRQTEFFTHTDHAITGFGYIPLPDVVVEARAPVDYTYYLDLDAEWKLVLTGDVAHVYTPPIRYNKPAVDPSKIQYEVKVGSVWRDTAAAMENLKRSLSSLAYIKAKENVRLVRDSGREPVAAFVRLWLMRTFADATNVSVQVHFPGDTLPGELRERFEESK